MLLAAAAMVACSTEDPEGNGSGNGNGNGTGTDDETYVENADGTFTYHGDTYKTVTLSNGSVWMAEPLRYVPEGFTPSGDPAADSHIWFPYKLENNVTPPTKISADKAVALTDEESIKENGYLYDMYAALGGVEVTVDNADSFEGAQGICPPGWHIPTRADFFALCGLSNKAATGEEGNKVDENALFYDETYGGGKISLYDDAGWNYVRSGYRNRNGYSGTGSYQLTQLYSGNTTMEGQYGTPALTYMMSSTCYKPKYSTSAPTELTDIQFFSQMTTFTKIYPEGRVNVAYCSILSGQQLRCVKDAQ